jgi:hypothetical protein
VTLAHYIRAVYDRAPGLDLRERLRAAINTSNQQLMRRFT